MNQKRPVYIHSTYTCLIFLLLCCTVTLRVNAQKDTTTTTRQRNNSKPAGATQKPLFKPNPQKPEDRTPPAEKLAEKRWTIKRKLMQNMMTRYNYYYHAKKKLEGVIHSVNRDGQDNYNYLLPFYPYNVQNMGLNKNELDSVIEKASINIQIHDPRSKWIDDSYLLIGRAYFYQGEWENANKTFLFINNKFAPKKKSENKAVVGASEDDKLSIASREKRKGIIGRFKHIYVRNDAFLWRARTLLEQKEYDEVRSLLNILDQDPRFPKRLEGELAEVRAYTFYKQERFAEVIAPLQEAVKKKRNRDERARMAYILGQLYTNYNVPDSAMDMFRTVIRTKPDPMMDFQARIQIAKLNATAEGGSLEQSLVALEKMARKEKFYFFRDAIYYTMANLVAAKDPDAAIAYLQKSLAAESNNTLQRALTFKAVADIYYGQRQYRTAKNFYDSTAAVMPAEFADSAVVNNRKRVLTDVAVRVEAIQREDSLQQLAAMPEADRNILLEKMAAAIRKTAEEEAKKEKGRKRDDDDQPLENPFAGNGNNNSMAQAPKEEPGDWYFYNPASKTSGFSEFKRRWGNRQPTDNWRRSQGGGAAINQATEPVDDNGNPLPTPDATAASTVSPDSTTAETLAAGLPLAPEQLQKSDSILHTAWFDLGKLYHDGLDNAALAIETYDTLLLKYPEHPRKPEVIYSLYVWHNRLNHTAIANHYKDIVLNQYGSSKYASIIRFGGLEDVDKEQKKLISTAYDSVYVAYQRGDYAGALAQKQTADSTFGLNYLQPKFDLLEAMILIKTDTIATDTTHAGMQAITAVMSKYASDDGVMSQAKAIIEALSRKQELVAYLGQLQLQPQDTTNVLLDENITMRYPWQDPHPQFDSLQLKTAMADSLKVVADKIAAPPPPMKPVTPYKLDANNPHFVILSFQKVSKVLMDEGLSQFTRYNAEKHATDKIQVGTFVLSPQEIMLIFRLFPNEDKALDYYDEIREAAPEKIIPRIRPSDYKLYVISRDNFILLNNTKDLDGYRKFFNDTYITQ